MFPVSNLFLALSSLHTTSAAIHHLFVGTFGQASLYTVAFDDEALTLDLVKNSTASAGHSWIAFDVFSTTTPKPLNTDPFSACEEERIRRSRFSSSKLLGAKRHESPLRYFSPNWR
jgi:hypothetical protein